MKKKMANRKILFVSSVQRELNAERQAIKNLLQNDPLLGRFFDVFLLIFVKGADDKARHPKMVRNISMTFRESATIWDEGNTKGHQRGKGAMLPCGNGS